MPGVETHQRKSQSAQSWNSLDRFNRFDPKASSDTRSPRPASGRGAGGEGLFSDRTANVFFLPKPEIEGNIFDVSIEQCKEIVHETEQYDAPKVLLKRIETVIAMDLEELEGMLG